jgi:hypothetical protein
MKQTTQFRILALEPDPDRGQNLKRLIGEHVNAEVTIATSSHVAITLLSQRVPDLVLTSLLVAPADEEKLMSHLKQVEGTRDVPVLTVPPVITEEDAPRRGRRMLGFRKRGGAPFPSFDRDVVGVRIAEALEASRARTRTAPPVSIAGPVGNQIEEPAPMLPAAVETSLVLARTARQLRERAERLNPSDIPWLGSVQTQSGLKLDLLNISSTGLLVESASKFMPDSVSELHLLGSEKTLIVPARFVRSEVAAVNGLGVRYHTAAVFDRAIDLVLDRGVYRTASRATPKALAELLMRITTQTEFAHGAHARMLFEEGLRQLVPARDIQIRTTPAACHDGETVYFTVPTGNESQPVLQVTFEPDYQPAHEELNLLKAAASVAAVVLQHGHPRSLVACNAW